MLALALFCLPLAASETWTVDDSGPADFSSIAEAIPLVSAGDTLLVLPGTYDAFTLDKSLKILGSTQEQPIVTGDCYVIGADEFTIAGFQLDSLEVKSVPGRGQIDDCVIGPPQSHKCTLIIEDCDQVLISRSTFWGRTGVGDAWKGGYDGIVVIDSSATIVQCYSKGGNGGNDGCAGEDGGNGLLAQGSFLVCSGSSFYAGPGGSPTGGLGCCCEFGNLGMGMSLEGCTAVIRGEGDDGSSGNPGIQASSSIVVISGVSTGSIETLDGSTVIQSGVFEPFLEIHRDEGPGISRELRVYGPDGVHGILVFSRDSDLFSLPGYDLEIWLDQSKVVAVQPVATHGPGAPTAFDLTMPSWIPGFTMYAQAVFPALSSPLQPEDALVTNSSSAIVRF